MSLEAIAEHYRRAGWSVLERPEVGVDAPFFRPDLLLQRRGVTKAVLVRTDPANALEIGRFAAQCKRNDIPGLVICEVDEGVRSAAELQGLDVLAIDEFYAAPQAPALRPAAPAPTPGPATPEAEEEPVAFEELVPPGIPWWRWAIVAAIWLAALLAVARWILLVA